MRQDNQPAGRAGSKPVSYGTRSPHRAGSMGNTQGSGKNKGFKGHGGHSVPTKSVSEARGRPSKPSRPGPTRYKGTVFYLDLPDIKKADVTSKLDALGGQVELFFNPTREPGDGRKYIVITNDRRPANAPADTASRVPGTVGGTTPLAPESPYHVDGEPTEGPSGSALTSDVLGRYSSTRAGKMMMRAVTEAQGGGGGGVRQSRVENPITSQAMELGHTIWYYAEIIAQLTRQARAVKANAEDAKLVKGDREGDKTSLAGGTYTITITDLVDGFKPIVHSWSPDKYGYSTVPVVNPTFCPSGSIFASESQMKAKERKQAREAARAKAREERRKQRRAERAAESPPRRLARLERRERDFLPLESASDDSASGPVLGPRPGYCELCVKTYPVYADHIVEPAHLKLARSRDGLFGQLHAEFREWNTMTADEILKLPGVDMCPTIDEIDRTFEYPIDDISDLPPRKPEHIAAFNKFEEKRKAQSERRRRRRRRRKLFPEASNSSEWSENWRDDLQSLKAQGVTPRALTYSKPKPLSKVTSSKPQSVSVNRRRNASAQDQARPELKGGETTSIKPGTVSGRREQDKPRGAIDDKNTGSKAAVPPQTRPIDKTTVPVHNKASSGIKDKASIERRTTRPSSKRDKTEQRGSPISSDPSTRSAKKKLRRGMATPNKGSVEHTGSPTYRPVPRSPPKAQVLGNSGSKRSKAVQRDGRLTSSDAPRPSKKKARGGLRSDDNKPTPTAVAIPSSVTKKVGAILPNAIRPVPTRAVVVVKDASGPIADDQAVSDEDIPVTPPKQIRRRRAEPVAVAKSESDASVDDDAPPPAVVTKSSRNDPFGADFADSPSSDPLSPMQHSFVAPQLTTTIGGIDLGVDALETPAKARTDREPFTFAESASGSKKETTASNRKEAKEEGHMGSRKKKRLSMSAKKKNRRRTITSHEDAPADLSDHATRDNAQPRRSRRNPAPLNTGVPPLAMVPSESINLAALPRATPSKSVRSSSHEQNVAEVVIEHERTSRFSPRRNVRQRDPTVPYYAPPFEPEVAKRLEMNEQNKKNKGRSIKVYGNRGSVSTSGPASARARVKRARDDIVLQTSQDSDNDDAIVRRSVKKGNRSVVINMSSSGDDDSQSGERRRRSAARPVLASSGGDLEVQDMVQPVTNHHGWESEDSGVAHDWATKPVKEPVKPVKEPVAPTTQTATVAIKDISSVPSLRERSTRFTRSRRGKRVVHSDEVSEPIVDAFIPSTSQQVSQHATCTKESADDFTFNDNMPPAITPGRSKGSQGSGQSRRSSAKKAKAAKGRLVASRQSAQQIATRKKTATGDRDITDDEWDFDEPVQSVSKVGANKTRRAHVDGGPGFRTTPRKSKRGAIRKLYRQ